MKHLKKVLIGILVFLMGLTSVYAADIGIKSVNIKDKSSTIEVTDPTASGTSIDSTIKFHKLNDYVTLEVNLDTDKTITGVSDNNESEFIKSSYTYDGSKFYLTLKYDKELSGALDLEDLEITVNFSDGSSATINPNTNDNIHLYIIMFIIALFGLGVGLNLSKKKLNIVTVLMLALLPMAVFAKETISSTYNLKVEHISVVPTLTITYAAGDATTSFASKEITKGEGIGDFPTVTKENYTLDNWYKESSFGTVVDSSYAPTQDATIYAKLLKSMKGATVSPTEIEIEVAGTETITVSNVEETYTFTSDDDNTASVDQDGVVTGVAEGTTTITITGDKSGETKTVSVTVTAPASVINYVNRQVDGQITIGDEIAIGDEHFYVVNTNSSKTAVLAKYNLYVGDIMASDFSEHETISTTDAKYGKQDPLAIGSKSGLSQFYGVVAFSGAQYWTSSQYANAYDSSRSTVAPEYTYNQTGGTAQDNGYTIAYYVEQYLTSLKTAGAPDTMTARLLLKTEAEALGCEELWMCENAQYSWVYATSFWTGSVVPDAGTNTIGFIHTNRQYEANVFRKDNQFGVRPVIVLDTSDLG